MQKPTVAFEFAYLQSLVIYFSAIFYINNLCIHASNAFLKNFIYYFML